MNINWKDVKEKVDQKTAKIKSETSNLWETHAEDIIIYSVIGLPLAAKIAHSISKAVVAQKEEKHRLLVDYDPSTGWYNELKRPLTTQEKANVIALKKAENITMTEALLRLNLLK